MICPDCHKEMPDQANFCSNCGRSFGNAAQEGPGQPQHTYQVNAANSQGVITGDNPHVEITYQAPQPDIKSLREAYLNRVFEACAYLSLAGIDRKAASEAETRLNLSAVYTALLTTGGEEAPLSSKGQPELERQRRQLSALEQMDRRPRLVLLGDPGSGKSTFVSFAALCLAGEALGNDAVNLKLLTAPLPDDDESVRIQKLLGKTDQQEPPPQPWGHGVRLPVRVILRDFAARGLPPAGESGKARHLMDFIGAELAGAGLEGFREALFDELRSTRGGLLFLDGLDEVPSAAQRRKQLQQVVEDFAASFPHCRILVTSRTYAYQKQDWRLSGFEEAILAPFSRGQIERFVDRWYAHMAGLRSLDSDGARGRAELLKQVIRRSDRLSGLAERPLLLTLIASLHAWRGGTLPEKREELYADTVDLLLDWWESPKAVYDAQGKIIASQPSLAEWLKVDRQRVRSLLNELAFNAHRSQPELQGTADIAEGDLVSGLMRISQNQEVNPALLVEYLSSRAGLLTPRGVGVYTFPHRTFQEYLAACYLTDHDYPERIAELACQDFNRWREVALLAGAKAARGAASTIWSLVEALCYQDISPKPCESGPLWGAFLAGQALVETANLSEISERNRPKVERVRRWLVQVLQSDRLPALERAGAGTALAGLGDPRFIPERGCLPDEPLWGFVPIPAGSFQMGSDKKQDPDTYDDEQPAHPVTLPDYWIARYPVTVAQFRAFVQESGYKDAHRASLGGPENHPVVNVTWFDALAYCSWLTGKLRQAGQEILVAGKLDASAQAFWGGLAQGRLAATLPSEAEWEKAARGTGGRRYPWGAEFDPDKANIDETGLNTTSPVGCFPAGASPYGLLDMSGNVWEWTRSLFEKYPYDPGDGRENLEDKNSPRVVRGGSFILFRRGARCAYRFRLNPDLRDDYYGFRALVSPQSLAPGVPEALGR